MIGLFILNNFASSTTGVNWIVSLNICDYLKNLLRELVLGFSLNLDKTTAAQFSALSRSIIIKKRVELWHSDSYNRVILKMSMAKCTQNLVDGRQVQ